MNLFINLRTVPYHFKIISLAFPAIFPAFYVIFRRARAIACEDVMREDSRYELKKAHKTAHIDNSLYSDYLVVLAQIIGMLASQNPSCISVKQGKLMLRYELLTMIVEKIINEKIVVAKIIVERIDEKRLGIKAFTLNRPPP